MYLNRVRVSDYTFEGQQILKDVDIKFERDLIYKIFPLGGQQGCGKSTLLKMIFAKKFFAYRDSVNSRIYNAIDLDISEPTVGDIYLLTTSIDEGLISFYDLPFILTFDQIKDRYRCEMGESRAMHKYRALLEFISTTKGSIILMDNPDQGLHPDWQYALCSDIAHLGTSNQFIVATHSYEFCNALTPHHVKIIESGCLANAIR